MGKQGILTVNTLNFHSPREQMPHQANIDVSERREGVSIGNQVMDMTIKSIDPELLKKVERAVRTTITRYNNGK
jgi:hypothetical protein